MSWAYSGALAGTVLLCQVQAVQTELPHLCPCCSNILLPGSGG